MAPTAETPTPPNPPDLPLRTRLCFDAALPVSYADEPRVVFYMDGRSEPPCVVLRNPQFSNMIANFFSPGEASQGNGDGRDRLSSRLLVSLNPSLTNNIGETTPGGPGSVRTRPSLPEYLPTLPLIWPTRGLF